MTSQTKNGKARASPFNEILWGLFSQLRTRQDVPWVFHNAAGHRWDDVRHGFDRACDAAGLTDFHFHDLRHTFASWLIMRGVPLATVSNLLGHTSPSMTLRYVHLSPKHLTSAVRLLDGAQTCAAYNLSPAVLCSPQEEATATTKSFVPCFAPRTTS